MGLLGPQAAAIREGRFANVAKSMEPTSRSEPLVLKRTLAVFSVPPAVVLRKEFTADPYNEGPNHIEQN